MADKDKQAGSATLGGARIAGVRNDRIQATYDRHSQMIRTKWSISDVLDAFPTNIRPKSLGSSAISNLKNIAAKKTLTEARDLFIRECQGRDGIPFTVGWTHTEKIWKVIKDDTVLPGTIGSPLVRPVNTTSDHTDTDKLTQKAVPIDHSQPKPKMRPKKNAAGIPQETPNLIIPGTDKRSAPFATATSTANLTQKTGKPTPKFDVRARATKDPIGFLEPKVSPQRKSRSVEELVNPRSKQTAADLENLFSEKISDPYDNEVIKKPSQRQEDVIRTPATGILENAPKKRTISQRDIVSDKGPTTEVTIDDLSIELFGEPIGKKPRLSEATEAAAQRDAELIQGLKEGFARSEPRLAEINARLEADDRSENSDTIIVGQRTPVNSSTRRIPSTTLTTTEMPNGSSRNSSIVSNATNIIIAKSTGGNHTSERLAAIGLLEEVKKQLSSLPESIKGFINPQARRDLDKEDVDRDLVARVNAVLATAARHLEADLAWLFKERAK